MNQKKPLPFQFPKKFMWGAATSAHQVEGGTHNQWSVWELENAKSLAQQAGYKQEQLPVWKDIKRQASTPDNYISGTAVDHYNRYEEDFVLLKKMNMNSFRFSIEWSRVEPREGTWDAAALAHYKKYVASLKARKIEPVVTLFHFTLPVWFAEKGGFEKRRNIKYFVRFAEKIMNEIGASIRYVVTINEPEVYALQSYHEGSWPPNKMSRLQMIRVYINLARAHNKVAQRLHQMSRRYKVAVAKNVAHHYAGDDALLSRATARIARWVHDDFFLRLVKRQSDWIGVNYYFSNRYYGYRRHNPDEQVSDLGWNMEPANIQHVLEHLFVAYNKPLIITENGLADQNDEFRQWWLTHTFLGMYRAMQNGVPLEGYLHWSLIDNFEWAYGHWPKFGLFAIDEKTGKRIPRRSAAWLAKLLRRIQE